MRLQLHALCAIHTAITFPPRVSCAATLTVNAQRHGAAAPHRAVMGINSDPLKDLSNTRALKHLAPLSTDYWTPPIVSSNLGHTTCDWKRPPGVFLVPWWDM